MGFNNPDILRELESCCVSVRRKINEFQFEADEYMSANLTVMVFNGASQDNHDKTFFQDNEKACSGYLEENQ